MKWLDNISLTLVIIGALNWLLIGIFRFDLVAFLFGNGYPQQASAGYPLLFIPVAVPGSDRSWPSYLRKGAASPAPP